MNEPLQKKIRLENDQSLPAILTSTSENVPDSTPVNESASSPVNESVSTPINESASTPVNESASTPVSELTKSPITPQNTVGTESRSSFDKEIISALVELSTRERTHNQLNDQSIKNLIQTLLVRTQ